MVNLWSSQAKYGQDKKLLINTISGIPLYKSIVEALNNIAPIKYEYQIKHNSGASVG